ncbi:MAG: phage BR0599 family protein [Verrucomicrobia bacterium]|nr:phage BR0599 family protein [Verrucomicrobiota bacterium]
MTPQSVQLRGGRVAFWLLALPPVGGIELSVSLPVQVETALCGQEIRRPINSTLRFNQSYDTTVTGQRAAALVKWLEDHGTELVAVPLWAALCGPAEDRSQYRAAAWVAMSGDYCRAEVFTGTLPAWVTPDDSVAPLVFGTLENRSVDDPDGGVSEFAVEHVERSEPGLAVAIRPFTEPVGPVVSAGGAPALSLCPFLLDGRSVRESVSEEIDREEIGFGREPEEHRDRPGVRELQVAAVATSRTELARLLSFFCERSAAVPFWIPAPIEASAPALKLGDWLAYSTPGRAVEFGQVRSITAGVPVVFPERVPTADTFVSRLMLMRFRSDSLTVQQRDPRFASATLSLREVPAVEDHGGRTFVGEAAGAVQPRAWLYEIRSDVWVERMTSHDVPIPFEDQLWVPAPVTHGQIGSSVTGLRDGVRVQLGASVSELAMLTIARKAPARLGVRIIEATLGRSGVLFSETVFTGEMEAASLGGVTISITFRPWPVVSSLRLPRCRIQPGCNHAIYRPGCGLDPADWEFMATVSAPGAPGYPFTFGLAGLAGPETVTEANWFAGGWVEFGRDKISIRSSTAPSGGALTVTLARDPREFPESGASLKLFPGCDGRWETCGPKFDNALNFGGHPHIPTSNPSLVKLSPAVNGGKK